jgi:hypothetical protein
MTQWPNDILRPRRVLPTSLPAIWASSAGLPISYRARPSVGGSALPEGTPEHSPVFADALKHSHFFAHWSPTPRDSISVMHCAECDALMAAFTIAAGNYAAVAEALLNTGVADQEYSKLKSDAEQARRVCEKAKEALRVTRKGTRDFEIIRAELPTIAMTGRTHGPVALALPAGRWRPRRRIAACASPDG